MFKQKIIDLIVKATNLPKEKVNQLAETPPNPDLGDYAFPCFVLSDPKNYDEMWKDVEKDFFIKKSPVEIASHLKDLIEKKLPPEVEKVDTKGPYLNFFLNKKKLATQVIKINSNYGKQNKGGKIMIEFSQPNTHKAFHVGHIRGTSLGESLARIFEFTGAKVTRANYSGDTGMHIAKWIWCYINFHSKEKLTDDEAWIAGIYVDAIKRLTKNEKLQKQVDEINRKIESKSDKKINDLWKKTRQLSIKSWDRIYKELGTKFDRHYFESELEESGKKFSQELLKKQIAEISEGAVIINLEKYTLGIWVLLRKDGTVLYSAKDIALVKHKLNDQKLDEYIIISGDEQNFHFKQLFKTLELMKMSKKDKFEHIGFGMVRLPDRKMSSRTGDNILYSNFKKGITEFAKKNITKKWKNLNKKELEERALKIAIASMKYAMLSQDSNKPIIFDKEKALEFEGNTGPYLQYTYARASSILRKAKKSTVSLKIPELSKSEQALIKKISDFPEIVALASLKREPNLIANYSYDLAKSFNEFYHDNKVIGSKEQAFRLKLIEVFRITLKNALFLLGIEVMEEM